MLCFGVQSSLSLTQEGFERDMSCFLKNALGFVSFFTMKSESLHYSGYVLNTFFIDFLVLGEAQTFLFTTVWMRGNSIRWQADPSKILDFFGLFIFCSKSEFQMFSCLISCLEGNDLMVLRTTYVFWPSEENLTLFLDFLRKEAYEFWYFLICMAALVLFLEMMKLMDSLLLIPSSSSFRPNRFMLRKQLRSRSKIYRRLQCSSSSAKKQPQKFYRECRKTSPAYLLLSSPSLSLTILLSSVRRRSPSLLLPHFLSVSANSPLDHSPSHPRQMTALSSHISRRRQAQMCEKWKGLAKRNRNQRQSRCTRMLGSSLLVGVWSNCGQNVRKMESDAVMNWIWKYLPL